MSGARFEDRVVVVTGGGRGIGAACARRFAAEGAALVIADIEVARAEETAAEVRAHGREALAVMCDVTDRAAVEVLVEASVQRFSQVDVLVACAGMLRFNLVQDIDEFEWDMVVDTHLKGAFFSAQAAQAVMAPRRYGKIALISSVAAKGDRGRTHYSAAKAGIEAMTRTLAIELGEFNINVNAVAPGMVETRMPKQHADWLGEDYEAFKAQVVAQTPLGRAGTPEEQAAAITFLCSDDASFITGETLHVSGGL